MVSKDTGLMDCFDAFSPKAPMRGSLMLAAPFLPDNHFSRAVILLCEHEEEGSVGYVLNHLARHTLQDVVEEKLSADFPIYIGGPVQRDTLHYLHNIPQLIEVSTPINEHLYWGQDFDPMIDLLRREVVSSAQIKFFAGYAGWDDGQLDEEISARSWIVRHAARPEDVFEDAPTLWSRILQHMGKPYASFARFPEDPTCN